MKNKQTNTPTKKKILMYYLMMGTCLLVVAALTVGLVFGLKPNDNPVIDNNPIEKPDDGNNPDDEKPPVTDTSTMYEFIAPVKNVTVTQTHVLWHNKTLDHYRLHNGMDFAAAAGTEVLAAVDGTVKNVFTSNRLYGALIELEHADGVRTVYKYIEPNENLKAGDKVNRGDVIGKVAAATGSENADGDHLHFEVYKNNIMQDPDIYLKLISK